MLALGTGVGGAIWHGGRFLRGDRGYAGELGHLPVLSPLDYRCVCGGQGCLEQYASGRGLAERATALIRSGDAEDLARFVDAAGEHVTSRQVVQAVDAGVPSAQELVGDAARALAQAMVSLSVAVEPSVIYLGGSIGHAMATYLLPLVRAELEERWPFAASLPAPAVRLDLVGPHAAALGAASAIRGRQLARGGSVAAPGRVGRQ